MTRTPQPGDRTHRLDAIEENLDWLRDHDLDEHSTEAAKRLGLIMGDARALSRAVGDNADGGQR